MNLWQASHAEAPTANISTITWFDYNAPDNIPAAIHDSYAHDGALRCAASSTATRWPTRAPPAATPTPR